VMPRLTDLAGGDPVLPASELEDAFSVGIMHVAKCIHLLTFVNITPHFATPWGGGPHLEGRALKASVLSPVR
jgi:hypothetical protein